MATLSIGQISEHDLSVRAFSTAVGLKSELTTGRLRDSKYNFLVFIFTKAKFSKVLNL